MAETDDRWWYNVDTGQVEQGPAKRGVNDGRLGPYATQEEAARGLDRLKERNKQLDEEDRRWEEG